MPWETGAVAQSSLTDAYGIGRRYEDGLDAVARRRGAHFTPPAVAELLVARSFAAWDGSGFPVVCDPSCGGGVFLVAAAEALAARGADPRTVVDELVVGIDLDPGAAGAAAEGLRAWAAGHGVADARPRVVVADALEPDMASRTGPVDVVVGNPPFQNQLGGATARRAAERDALTTRFGAAVGGYVDVAALFQLVALDLVREGGVVTLIQPRSFLVARDVAAVRERLLDAGRLGEVWLPGVSLFDAKVDVCATVLVVGGRGDAAVSVVGGRDADILHGSVDGGILRASPTWSAMWAVANGVPEVVAASGATSVGSVATATAGFRDQYYGLLDHLHEREPQRGAQLVTTAMIDPARCSWGDRTVTVARRRRTTPWVDLAALEAADERLAAWVRRLAVPKVLVATQTKVIEAVADLDGRTVAFTPVIAVVPTDGVTAARIEAALLAPAATAWAMRRFGGAGMSANALKLAAKQVLEIPLPVHREPWDEAVSTLRGSSASETDGERVSEPDWREFGRLMNAAWGIDDDALVEWWLARLPNVERIVVDPIH